MADQQSPAQSKLVSSAVIEQSGKYLLVQEAQKAAYGLWNFPGGHVDTGETLEQAAVREAREETGLEVSITRQLVVLHSAVGHPVLHAYEATITGGDLKPQTGEILDVRWFTSQEILAMKAELRNSEYVLGALSKLQT